jgi:hypothetical protein
MSLGYLNKPFKCKIRRPAKQAFIMLQIFSVVLQTAEYFVARQFLLELETMGIIILLTTVRWDDFCQAHIKH